MPGWVREGMNPSPTTLDPLKPVSNYIHTHLA